ncbi:MAG: type III-B CRISPR module-associated protein Cmr5 [Chloroflexota bacterium]
MTRQQEHLRRALADVRSVLGSVPESQSRDYGRQCHALPILVRTNGLCQTLAFLESKAKTGNGQDLLLTHIAGVVGSPRSTLLDTIRDATTADYQRLTRTILEASVYYKRFAVSVLNVDNSSGGES